jgi:hypothetical protein
MLQLSARDWVEAPASIAAAIKTAAVVLMDGTIFGMVVLQIQIVDLVNSNIQPGDGWLGLLGNFTQSIILLMRTSGRYGTSTATARPKRDVRFGPNTNAKRRRVRPGPEDDIVDCPASRPLSGTSEAAIEQFSCNRVYCTIQMLD